MIPVGIAHLHPKDIIASSIWVKSLGAAENLLLSLELNWITTPENPSFRIQYQACQNNMFLWSLIPEFSLESFKIVTGNMTYRHTY